MMNALGAMCWSSVVGGGTYLLGDRIHGLSGTTGMTLLAGALGFGALGAFLIRRHEALLEGRARAVLGLEMRSPSDGNKRDRHG